MFELKGKVALITGGLGGMGLEIMKTFLKENVAGITLLDLKSEERERLLNEATINYPKRVLFIPTDVTNEHEIKAAFEKTVDAFGRVDILVNAAGVLDNNLGWRKCVEINLVGTMDATLSAIETCMTTGIIVNVSSVVALGAVAAVPSYCATKSGIIGFTKAIALKLDMEEKDIKIFAVCPGATKTPMFLNNIASIDNDRKKIFEQTIQEPSYLADSLAKLMPSAKNGSVWVIENNETYEIEMPDYKTLKK